jgi:hypothetical protein
MFFTNSARLDSIVKSSGNRFWFAPPGPNNRVDFRAAAEPGRAPSLAISASCQFWPDREQRLKQPFRPRIHSGPAHFSHRPLPYPPLD